MTIHLRACEAMAELKRKHPEIAPEHHQAIHAAIVDALDRQRRAIITQVAVMLAPEGAEVR